MVRLATKSSVLAIGIALSCSCNVLLTSEVKADLVNVGGKAYSIQTLTGSFNSNQTILKGAPWWGNGATAKRFAEAWFNGGFATSNYAYFGYDIAPTLTGSGVQSYLVSTQGAALYANANSPSVSSSRRYAYALPLPSKTSSVKSSGSKIVVSTGSGISKNSGKVAGGKLTYLTTTSNTNSSTFLDLFNVISALSSLDSADKVDAAWEQLTAEPYASNLSVGLESMNRFRENALAIAFADNKISYTKTEKVKVCLGENGEEIVVNNLDTVKPAEDAGCEIRKVKTKLPWSIVIDGTNTQASLTGTEDLGSLDYNIFQSAYGVEYALSDEFSIGGVFGYGQNNLYNYEFADTRVNSDTYSAGLYGIYKPSEPATIALFGGYSYFDTESRRPIQFASINRLAKADWNSNGYTVALAAEYALSLSKSNDAADPEEKEQESRNAILLKPNALISFASYSQGLIKESGAQSLNLRLDPHTATSVILGTGLVLETPIVLSAESRLIPRLGVGYRYDINGNSDEEHEVTGGFVELPEAGDIDVFGQNRGSNDIDVSLGLEYEISSNTAIYSNVVGSFWSNGTELTYGVGFRYSW